MRILATLAAAALLATTAQADTIRDGVTAGLTEADPRVLDQLRKGEARLREALGYPQTGAPTSLAPSSPPPPVATTPATTTAPAPAPSPTAASPSPSPGT